ncbi:MAG: glutamine--tRNA ligase/YqeY domain fusion protein [Gammaproteobacteria bacterium]|nr:MAG: glutamine--tRNA ligase/YqeY domain fusion protein [Gammaproteobacteria bacterium]
MTEKDSPERINFIRQIIDADIASNKHNSKVLTRFPPEPNGHLHIGHAKSIVLNFSIANNYKGKCNLRFDDTNPHKENVEFVEAIEKDVEWLGYQWNGPFFASDYFEKLFSYAVELINKGLAYVDDQDAEQIRASRGTLTEPGIESPSRNRNIEENLELFNQMRSGKFPDGSKVLRAKIDMASPNINMRDPVIYRIRHGVIHHQTGNEWCLYPMYDFTHPISDAIEGITHSLCTLEFEDHRPLYDWVLDNITIDCHPQQIEFARLNLEYTVMSKRLLTNLVEQGHVTGWDDPRMPTICGLRRRGYTPESVREFCDQIGVTKNDSTIEMGVLESVIRDELNENAPRRLAVLNPLKVIITNYPDGEVEEMTALNHPQRPEMGTRLVPFSREIFIERDDFMEDAPKKFFRLSPGKEVRLRFAYYITCDEVIKDDAGNILELRCSYDPASRGGSTPDGRKVKGTIHWVSAQHAVNAEVRLYDRLFKVPNPAAEESISDALNPESLAVLTDCKLEPTLSECGSDDRFQFERLGYFYPDTIDHHTGSPVFNRIVSLRDSWAKTK